MTDDLYRALILEHGRAPRNRRPIANADGIAEAYNPLCGDEVSVAVALDGETIRDAAFEGRGCAIVLASASLMTSAVAGTTMAGAHDLADRFRRYVAGDAAAAPEGDLAAFGGVAHYPARIKCATLPWQALRTALEASRPGR